MKTINKCRICNNTDLIPIVSLGNQRISSVFPSKEEAQPSYSPLELVRCNSSNDENNCEESNEKYYVPMVEVFTAYTYSIARSNLKGRISHTLGAKIQYILTEDDFPLFYRAYYGLDVDINPKLKAIGEIFYDPYYLELWQGEFGDLFDNDISTFTLSNKVVEKPSEVIPIHLDFGFIYAINESFRVGFHFQQPFIAFYWKF